MKRLVLFSVLFTLAFGSTFGAALDGEAPVLVVAMLPGEYAAEAAELPDEDAGGAADEDACAICLTAFDALSIAELGQRTECCNPVAPHTFHLECALAWQERSGNLQCPTHDGAEFGPEVMEVGVTRAKASFWREVRDFIKHRENVRFVAVLGTDLAIQRILKCLYLQAIDHGDRPADAIKTYGRSSIAASLGLTGYLVVCGIKTASERATILNFLKQKADYLFKHEVLSKIVCLSTGVVLVRGSLELLIERLGRQFFTGMLTETAPLSAARLSPRLFEPIITTENLGEFYDKMVAVVIAFTVIIPTIHYGGLLKDAIGRRFRVAKHFIYNILEPDFFEPNDFFA